MALPIWRQPVRRNLGKVLAQVACAGRADRRSVAVPAFVAARGGLRTFPHHVPIFCIKRCNDLGHGGAVTSVSSQAPVFRTTRASLTTSLPTFSNSAASSTERSKADFGL